MNKREREREREREKHPQSVSKFFIFRLCTRNSLSSEHTLLVQYNHFSYLLQRFLARFDTVDRHVGSNLQ